MKRAILFKPGFKAIYFEKIDKKMNIGPEQEDRKGRGTNFSNFLLEKFLNSNFELMKGSWSRHQVGSFFVIMTTKKQRAQICKQSMTAFEENIVIY